jgi:hypothetical protein
MLLRKVVVATALGFAGTLLRAVAVRSGWLCGLALPLIYTKTISVCDSAQDSQKFFRPFLKFLKVFAGKQLSRSMTMN